TRRPGAEGVTRRAAQVVKSAASRARAPEEGAGARARALQAQAVHARDQAPRSPPLVVPGAPSSYDGAAGRVSSVHDVRSATRTGALLRGPRTVARTADAATGPAACSPAPSTPLPSAQPLGGDTHECPIPIPRPGRASRGPRRL